MRQNVNLIVLLGVASAFVTSAFVLANPPGQAQDTPANVIVVEKKVVVAKNVAVPDPKEEEPKAAVKKAVAAPPVVEGDVVIVAQPPAGEVEAAAPPVITDVQRLAVPDAPIGLMAPGVDNEHDPMTQQYVQQLRPLLKSEYTFIKSVCNLTREQRKTVAREAEKALKATARKWALLAQQPSPANQPVRAPRKLLQEALAKTVKATLSKEQVARFQEEFDKRAAHQKTVAVENFVVKLDQDLVLSPDQRETLKTSLAKNWDDAWCPSIEAFVNFGDQFFPQIPDKLVAPILNPEQRKVWRTRQHDQQAFWNGVFFEGMDDQALEDANLGELDENIKK